MTAATKKAKRAAHYAANREKVLAQAAAYYAANKEKIAAYQAAYRAANRGRSSTSGARCRIDSAPASLPASRP